MMIIDFRFRPNTKEILEGFAHVFKENIEADGFIYCRATKSFISYSIRQFLQGLFPFVWVNAYKTSKYFRISRMQSIQ